MNTLLSYMYRDAHNYKQSGFVVFDGPPTPVLVQRLWAACATTQTGEHRFVPDQVDVANLREDMPGSYDDDTNWHEIEDVAEESGMEGASGGITFEQFVVACEAVEGWDARIDEFDVDSALHPIMSSLTPDEIELALITLSDLYENTDEVGEFLNSKQQAVADKVRQSRYPTIGEQ